MFCSFKLNTRHRELLSNTSLCRLLCFHTRPTGGYPTDKSALPSIKNDILASLVPFLNDDGGSFVSRLEPVELKHATVLYETGEEVRHVYFPNNSLISLVTEMLDGRIVEVGLVGSDGMSGLTALLGEGTSPERALSNWQTGLSASS